MNGQFRCAPFNNGGQTLPISKLNLQKHLAKLWSTITYVFSIPAHPLLPIIIQYKTKTYHFLFPPINQPLEFPIIRQTTTILHYRNTQYGNLKEQIL